MPDPYFDKPNKAKRVVAPGEGRLGGPRKAPKPQRAKKAAPTNPKTSQAAKDWAKPRSVFTPGKTITDAVPAGKNAASNQFLQATKQGQKRADYSKGGLEHLANKAFPTLLGLPPDYTVSNIVKHPVRTYERQRNVVKSREREMEKAFKAGDQKRLNELTREATQYEAIVGPLGGAPKVAKLAEDFIGPKTLGETVQAASKGARGVRRAQEAGYTPERAKRAAAFDEAVKAGGSNAQAVADAMHHLSGELPKIEFQGFRELTPEALDSMVAHIWESPLRPYERLRTAQALQKATKGTVPTNSELDLIEKVFGKANAAALADPKNLGMGALLKHYALDIWNLPRSVLASFDLSAPFRQGLVAGMRHPVIFARNFKPMVKSFGSDKVSQAVMDDIASRANVPLYMKAKLAITETHGAPALAREEAFPSPLADKVPGVKASGRGYTVFLNKMRADVFDHMIEAAKDAGVNVEDPQFLESLGTYINSATGRGKLPGKAEDAAVFLNSFLFSPRLLASRVNMLNPYYYYKLDPFVRKQAIRAGAQTAGAILTFLGMASQIPGWSVGLDPRSANFGKIRIRDTRIDVAGGFLPLLVLYSRLFKGEMVSSSSGKKMNFSGKYGDTNRWEVAQRFLESKMAPSPGLVRDLAKGKDFLGNPITWQSELSNLLVPLNIQGSLDTYRTEGSAPAAAGAWLLGSTGFGVQSYGDKKAKRIKAADKSRWGKPGGGSSSSGPDKSKWAKP